MGRFLLVLGLLLAAGPKPDKKDVPYLIHANTLVQTEVIKSTAQETAGEARYLLPGETSLARTPLALPIFMMDAVEIKPEKLRLIRLTVAGGHREAIMRKNPASDDPPLLLTVNNLGNGLYRFEAVNEIDNGEYALSASGSNQFFCFTVF